MWMDSPLEAMSERDFYDYVDGLSSNSAFLRAMSIKYKDNKKSSEPRIESKKEVLKGLKDFAMI